VHGGAFPGYGTALREEHKGDETAVSAGRATAKLHSLVPGRDRTTYGYALICCRISPDAWTKAEATSFSKNAIGSATTLPASATASANGHHLRFSDDVLSQIWMCRCFEPISALRLTNLNATQIVLYFVVMALNLLGNRPYVVEIIILQFSLAFLRVSHKANFLHSLIYFFLPGTPFPACPRPVLLFLFQRQRHRRQKVVERLKYPKDTAPHCPSCIADVDLACQLNSALHQSFVKPQPSAIVKPLARWRLLGVIPSSLQQRQSQFTAGRRRHRPRRRRRGRAGSGGRGLAGARGEGRALGCHCICLIR
jgi:hypothetical protein